jgi:hypothetical protein
MKTQLIKLQDKFILVSDEETKYPDYVWNGEHILGIAKVFKPSGQKIIAGIPELPSIDFSLLSEEDCKTIGYVDIEQLACNYAGNRKLGAGHGYPSFEARLLERGFLEGFKTAQSLSDKMFSLEDMHQALHLINNSPNIPIIGDAIEIINKINNQREKIIQSLQQPKVWNVEVEMEGIVDSGFIVSGGLLSDVDFGGKGLETHLKSMNPKISEDNKIKILIINQRYNGSKN